MDKKKNTSKKEKSDLELLITFIVLCAIVGLFLRKLDDLIEIINSLINSIIKKRISKDKEKKQINDIGLWLNNRIDQYEKDCLAYGIEIEADRQKISIFKKEELRNQYGKVLLQPTLTVYNEYSTLFGSDYSKLVNAINLWLKNNSIKTEVDNNSLKTIEKLIAERSLSAASRIVSEYMGNKNA